MVPHRVILAESSSPRRVLEWKSSRPRRVLKYRLKIRVSIYLFLSVGRKMTRFPETVSDPSKLHRTIWNACSAPLSFCPDFSTKITEQSAIFERQRITKKKKTYGKWPKSSFYFTWFSTDFSSVSYTLNASLDILSCNLHCQIEYDIYRWSVVNRSFRVEAYV